MDMSASQLPAGTRIGRRIAWCLVCGFCGLLAVPGLVEWWQPSGSPLPRLFRTDRDRYGLQIALSEIERHVVYDSKFANIVRRPYQTALTTGLGQGSRRVLIGASNFWFGRDDLLSSSGPGILSPTYTRLEMPGRNVVDEIIQAIPRRLMGKPRTAAENRTFTVPATALDVLTHFHRRLENAGVHLTIAIVPAKTAIYPDRLWPGYPMPAGPAVNRDFDAFVDALHARGVDAIDLAPAFWRARSDTKDALYLLHDSHWSPAGVDLGAAVVAGHIRRWLGSDVPPVPYSVRRLDTPEPTDLATLLGFRPGDPMAAGSPTTLHVVSAESANGLPAAVILFGDSMTGYYEADGAGFRSQLARHLGADVRSFVGYGAELPSAIAHAFRTEPSLLQGVKVVVLELHMFQLSNRTFSSLLPIESSDAR